MSRVNRRFLPETNYTSEPAHTTKVYQKLAQVVCRVDRMLKQQDLFLPGWVQLPHVEEVAVVRRLGDGLDG